MTTKGVFGACLIAAALCLAGGGVYALRTLKQKSFDPETLCPEEGSRSLTLILADTTGSLGAAEQRRVQAIAKRERDGGSRGDRITVELLTHKSGNAVLEKLADLCNPGAEANPLFENPKHVAARYLNAFVEPIDGALASVKAADAMPASPIARSLRAVLGNLPGGAHHTKLILISTLMEDSADASAYDGTFDESALRRIIPPAARDQMNGWDIQILLLRRPLYAAQQDSAIAVWRQFFKAASGRDPAIVRF